MILVLAHHGVVDTLLFGVPAALAILALRWAEKRARARGGHDVPGGENVD